MKGKEKMKSLAAEDMLIRNDLKNYIDKSKINLKRKLIIGNKYAIKTKEPNKMSIYTNDNKFLGFIGTNNCMLLFETKKWLQYYFINKRYMFKCIMYKK